MEACAKCRGAVVHRAGTVMVPEYWSCVNCGWVKGTPAPVIPVSPKMQAIRAAVRAESFVGR